MASLRLFDDPLARACGRCSSLAEMAGSSLPSRRRRRALESTIALLLTFPLLMFPLRSVAFAASSAGPAEIVLIEGATYRARLKLSFLQCLASRDRIGKKLGRSGFSSVRVFMSARELPRDWPVPFRSKAGGCERYAEGTWSRPSIPGKRPSSIESWWVASSTPAAPR
jgi:hypothetical protein